MTQQINCPTCQTPIPVNIAALLAGSKFTCSNCSSMISINANSSGVVKEAMQKFDALKQKLSQPKDSQPS